MGDNRQTRTTHPNSMSDAQCCNAFIVRSGRSVLSYAMSVTFLSSFTRSLQKSFQFLFNFLGYVVHVFPYPGPEGSALRRSASAELMNPGIENIRANRPLNRCDVFACISDCDPA